MITGGAFVMRRYVVSVRGYGETVVLAASRGKALADCWRSDAFERYSFGDFLKLARVRLHRVQPQPLEITVEGRAAFGLGHDGQYVQFVYPGGHVVLNAHPLDVLPKTMRPLAYRGRAA